MYYWRIRKLRQRLIEGPLAEKTSFHYVLAITFFYMLLNLVFALAAYLAESSFILLFILLFFITKFVGIPLCFQLNGGTEGENFMQRYLALSWVEIVRFFVFGLLFLIVSLFIVEFFIGKQELQSPHFIFMGVFLLVWQVFFYWRMSKHFRYLQKARGFMK